MSQFSAGFTARSENIGDNTFTKVGYNRLTASLRLEKEDEEDEEEESDIAKLTYSLIIVRSLDVLLAIALLPYETWCFICKNDRLTIMLRIVLEVTLELIMWMIFAGASILTAATLILDDLCCGDNNCGTNECGRLLVKTSLNETTTRRNRERDYSIFHKDNDNLRIRRGIETGSSVTMHL